MTMPRQPFGAGQTRHPGTDNSNTHHRSIPKSSYGNRQFRREFHIALPSYSLAAPIEETAIGIGGQPVDDRQ
jgi:hypothetical protein